MLHMDRDMFPRANLQHVTNGADNDLSINWGEDLDKCNNDVFHHFIALADTNFDLVLSTRAKTVDRLQGPDSI